MRVRTTSGRLSMDDCALVLNAGSSSWKFCVYRQAEAEDWRVDSQGQIKAIGTAPHFSAKDSEGRVLLEKKLGSEMHPGNDALDALADWLRSQYGGSRVLG